MPRFHCYYQLYLLVEAGIFLGGKSVSTAKIGPTKWRRALLMTERSVCVRKFVCGLFNYLTQFTVPICFSRISSVFGVCRKAEMYAN